MLTSTFGNDEGLVNSPDTRVFFPFHTCNPAMAAFAKAAYNASAYGAFRPTYPKKLYDVILAYHRAGRGRCVDLGCGTGGLPPDSSISALHRVRNLSERHIMMQRS